MTRRACQAFLALTCALFGVIGLAGHAWAQTGPSCNITPSGSFPNERYVGTCSGVDPDSNNVLVRIPSSGGTQTVDLWASGGDPVVWDGMTAGSWSRSADVITFDLTPGSGWWSGSTTSVGWPPGSVEEFFASAPSQSFPYGSSSTATDNDPTAGAAETLRADLVAWVDNHGVPLLLAFLFVGIVVALLIRYGSAAARTA